MNDILVCVFVCVHKDKYFMPPFEKSVSYLSHRSQKNV